MRNHLVAAACAAAFGFGSVTAAAAGAGRDSSSPIPLAELLERAAAKTEADGDARLPLLDPASPGLGGIVGFEPVASDRVPHYLRMFGVLPEAAEPMADLARSVLYEGTIDPEVKMAMGLRTAQVDGAAYTAAHMARLLGASSRGERLLDAMASGNGLSGLGAGDRLAVRYAEALALDAWGFDDAEFRELRGRYSDSQIVELTLTACFFSYLNRLVEAVGVPVEPWALEPMDPETRPAASERERPARVALITEPEAAYLIQAAERFTGRGERGGGLNIGLPNSLRAMARSPEIASAWFGTFRAGGAGAVLDAEMRNYISNAVSYANQCHYCITHQVHKLANVGISIDQIAASIRSDEALTPNQRLAVRFARQLTEQPASTSTAAFDELREAFTDRGALEVVLVAATFNFMNRFTSGLRLPAEGPAQHTLDEVNAALAR